MDVTEPGLSTEAAARFLEVSQASVRRWSDSGLLPVKRVGRRRARRFAEGDLVRFRERDALADQPPEAEGRVRPQAHRHFATFYDNEAARLRMTVPFLLAGLRAAEPCFLVVAGPVRELYLTALEDQAPGAVTAAMERNRFFLLAGIGPRARDAFAAWEDAFSSALARGGTMMRVVGEMATERRTLQSEEEMLDYEFGYNAISRRFPSVTICQYDVREFRGDTILGALKAHPDLLDSRLGPYLL